MLVLHFKVETALLKLCDSPQASRDRSLGTLTSPLAAKAVRPVLTTALTSLDN